MYTQTDLTNVQNAILALATGERVVSVSIAGQTVEYQSVNLPKLRELRAEIQSELQSASGNSRFVLTSTSKGL